MIDEILVQRLVDRDLPATERQECIQRLRTKEQWQQVAVAFLEKQILDETIGSFAGRSDRIAAEVIPVSPSRRPDWPISRFHIRHLVAAVAGAMLLLASGYWIGTGQSSGRVVDRSESISAPATDRATEEKPFLNLTDALARCVTPVPDQFRLDLLQAGFVLNEDEKLTDVVMPFGGTIKMPIRRFDIQFLGASAFQ